MPILQNEKVKLAVILKFRWEIVKVLQKLYILFERNILTDILQKRKFLPGLLILLPVFISFLKLSYE